MTGPDGALHTVRVVRRRAADLPVSTSEGVVLRHALSFGSHYDPERTSFGALVAHNRDVLAPGAAYGAHEHRDVEILTWVVSGTMVHTGPDGSEDVVPAGRLQYLAAGTGWHHDERGGDATDTDLVQMWLAPGLEDPPPSAPARLVVVPDAEGDVGLAGDGDAAVTLRRGGVSLHLLRPDPGERRDLPPASFRHVHVLSGAVSARSPEAESGGTAPARPGDAVLADPGDVLELTGRGACSMTAGPEGAEVLVLATA